MKMEYMVSQEDICKWLAKNNMTRLTKENFSYIVGNCLHDSISYLIPDWNGKGKDLQSMNFNNLKIYICVL